MTYARFYKDCAIHILGFVRLHWDFEDGNPMVYHITSQDEVITWFLPNEWVWWTVTGKPITLEWYIEGSDINDACAWISYI